MFGVDAHFLFFFFVFKISLSVLLSESMRYEVDWVFPGNKALEVEERLTLDFLMLGRRNVGGTCEKKEVYVNILRAL